jgi:hypothetical protein
MTKERAHSLRITLKMITHTSLPDYVGDTGIFTYYNGMLFVSSHIQNYVHVYDYINFTLLTTITCGSYLSQS